MDYLLVRYQNLKTEAILVQKCQSVDILKSAFVKTLDPIY